MAKDLEQFDIWQNLWDQARKTKNFNSSSNKPKIAEDQFKDEPPAYWNVDDNEEETEQLLQEGKTTNPVYPDSVGKDQDMPKPAWVNDKLLKEIEKLKQRLYDLEVKLNTLDAGNGKWIEKSQKTNDKSVLRKIDSIKKQIDDLSDSLGVKDEPSISQWNTTTK